MKSIIYLSIFLACGPSSAQHQTSQMTHSFPKLEAVKIANLGPGCRLRLRLPNRAELGTRYESKDYPGRGGIGIAELPTGADRWGISLQCNKTSDDYVANGWAVRKRGKWVLSENEATAELIQLGALKFYELKAKNAEGWAVTYDDTYGEDQFRQRTLAYCSAKNAKAVCGEGKVGFLDAIKENKTANLTSGTLNMLRQFEFLNDLPSKK